MGRLPSSTSPVCKLRGCRLVSGAEVLLGGRGGQRGLRACAWQGLGAPPPCASAPPQTPPAPPTLPRAGAAPAPPPGSSKTQGTIAQWTSGSRVDLVEEAGAEAGPRDAPGHPGVLRGQPREGLDEEGVEEPVPPRPEPPPQPAPRQDREGAFQWRSHIPLLLGGMVSRADRVGRGRRP